jgi:hypothetical protein
MRLIVSLLIAFSFSWPCRAGCRVDDVQIGRARDTVVSGLKSRGCEIRPNAPENGLEDDLVIPPDNDRYAYYEVIFEGRKLAAVWSYSPVYTSAEDAFSRFYEELVVHSAASQPNDRAFDRLGQRRISSGDVVLQRPVTEEFRTIGIDVDDGTVWMKLNKAKGEAAGVRVETVRTR